MSGVHTFYRHTFSCYCACYEKRARLNSVRDNTVLCAMQFPYTLNDDPVCASTFDFGPHPVEEIGEVEDLGFACCSFNDSHSICQRRCHHHIVCAEHSRTELPPHVDLCPAQLRCENLDITAFHAHR